MSYSPDGTRIVSGSRDETLRQWDAVTGEPVGEPLVGHSETVTSVSYSPDGTRIVSGSWDKTLRIWDLSPWKDREPILRILTKSGRQLGKTSGVGSGSSGEGSG